jgi:hypothetical protein
MLYPNGRFKNHWREGHSVPDVSRPETKRWFYFLGASLMDRKRWYYANRPSPAIPDGLGDEDAIRAIWASDLERRKWALIPRPAPTKTEPQPPR